MAGIGGKTKGAGRKPGAITAIKREIAGDILAKFDEAKFCLKLLNSDNEKIALDMYRLLVERARGKAVESIKLSGDVDNPISVLVRHIGTAD
jgi:hypothetical protein